MRNCCAACAGAILGLVAVTVSGAAAEKLHKLSASQIRSAFVGMELTDGVHSSDVFQSDGTLVTVAMGRKTLGKWRTQKDDLCLERPKEDASCYEVWSAGNKVEFRRKGLELPLFEGQLRRPARRD